MSVSPSWRVRAFRDGDEEQVAQLFSSIFGKSQTAAEYRWKMVDVPRRTRTPNVWLAVDAERVIGQFGGMPVRFKLDEMELPSVHLCDVMTAPSHRRLGVLAKMAATAQHAWAEGDIAVGYALTYPGLFGTCLPRLGWRPELAVGWYRRPLRLDRFLPLRLPRPLGRLLAAAGAVLHRARLRELGRRAGDTEVQAVVESGPELDALWRDVGPRYRALVVRDRTWYRYRYLDSPWPGHALWLARRGGRPVGLLASRVTGEGRRTTGWLLDLFTDPADDASRSALMRCALDQLFRVGAGSIRVLAERSGPLAPFLRRCGFSPGRGGFDVSIAAIRPDLGLEAVREPGRRLVLTGDFDIV